MAGFQLHLAAPQDCPVAERVALALAPRGTTLERTVLRSGPGQVAGPARLTLSRTGDVRPVVVHDGLVMLELVEDLHPDQPLHPRDTARRARHRELMAQALRAQDRLAQVTVAQGPRDVDLEVHRLRGLLQALSLGIEPLRGQGRQPLSNLDVVLAPLLWRILLLDAVYETHLGTGFETLMARGRWLIAQPEVGEVLTPAVGEAWVAALIAGGGGIVAEARAPDWSRALGPEGAEKNLLPQGATLKFPSIGRAPGFR